MNTIAALIVAFIMGAAALLCVEIFCALWLNKRTGDVTGTCHRCGGNIYTHPRPWLCESCAGDFGTENEPPLFCPGTGTTPHRQAGESLNEKGAQ